MVNAINHVIQHWITSVAGVVGGGAAFTLLQSGCGTSNWKSWAIAVGFAALGLVAKDPGSKPPVQ